ncbi:TetR family transcriptional regulator [Rhodococcoides trifolii]|uniref:TetR family transcriptional regulator n=1 Tax=Rhodococcoides trifolii TaxID=908250 RepID=A0A917CUL4_9NOCA|nr:TetR/AcrR family transcriptional regulator [Rhodococcus trifolii]GGF98181.1 TetR family transcriptional regulator [Rhodococcus trifolii]
MTRQRLTPDERRTQLLTIGAQLFSERPYEDVWIEEVAERAGVSRGLMYHYFSSKRDFFAAIVRVAVDRILRDTEPDPALPVQDQITHGLDAYLTFVRENQPSVRALNRGELSADTEIRDMVDAELAEQQRRILVALGSGPGQDAVLEASIHGWIAFVRAVVVDWIETDALTEDQVRDLCLRALNGLIGTGSIDTVDVGAS